MVKILEHVLKINILISFCFPSSSLSKDFVNKFNEKEMISGIKCSEEDLKYSNCFDVLKYVIGTHNGYIKNGKPNSLDKPFSNTKTNKYEIYGEFKDEDSFFRSLKRLLSVEEYEQSFHLQFVYKSKRF